jgi:heptosyltransferase II
MPPPQAPPSTLFRKSFASCMAYVYARTGRKIPRHPGGAVAVRSTSDQIPQRILVIRFSSIGDILLTTPLLRLLRQAYPAASLEFLTKSAYQDVLRANPCLDVLHLFDPQGGLSPLLHTLRQQRYDVVLDLHGTLRSRVVSYAARARAKLVYNKRIVRRALFVWLKWNTLRALTPVPELYAAPLRRLGLTAPLPGLEMHLAPGSREAIQAYLQEKLPGHAAKPLLALAPGAAWSTKRWPVERFAEVAQAMAPARAAAVVILGGAADVPLGQALRHRLSVPVLDSTGQLSLMHSAALLKQCALLLSNDSGLMHMATALHIPVVALFGPTVQEFGFYPFQGLARVVSTALPCRPCSSKGSNRCPQGHHRCMQQLSSGQVLTAVQQMWDALYSRQGDPCQ